MKLEIDDSLIQKHFTDGQIKGFMRELNFDKIQTLMYLWFFNFVSIQLQDLRKDGGRGMYRKFAESVGEIISEV